MSVEHKGPDEPLAQAFDANRLTGVDPPGRYIRPKMAAQKLGIGLSTLWLKIKHDPEFPKSIKIGKNTTVLVEADIDRYVYTRSRPAR